MKLSPKQLIALGATKNKALKLAEREFSGMMEAMKAVDETKKKKVKE